MQNSNQDAFFIYKWKSTSRIVSLVPSLTELLYDLGLIPNLVGRTKYCVHPKEKLATITEVGGTKNIDIERILMLQPDIVIASKEENSKNQIEALQKKVYVELNDIRNYTQALQFIEYCGYIFQQNYVARSITENIRKKFDLIPFEPSKKALYFIWRNPYMVAGADNYIHSILGQLGFENCAEKLSGRYPEIDTQDLKNLSPDVIFLSSEPYLFNQDHAKEIAQLFPEAKLFLVDGEMFSWYGSRMLKAADYFLQHIELWKS